MVVLSSTTTAHSHCTHSITCKLTQPSLLYLAQLYKPSRASKPKPNGYNLLVVKSYMEESSSISGLAKKIIGAIPVIGLLAKIASDEGGIGGDLIDFAEFRRRVGNNCSVNDSRAFFDFQDRRGKQGDPLYVLLCCWLAAVGAGLLKSEEILEGVARLRISDDIEFEEQSFIAKMNDSRERRAKLKSPAPSIPMVIRAEKALEAIYVCCFGRDPIEREDEELLSIMLTVVFPTVGRAETERMVREKAKKIADGTDEVRVPEPKPLPKEAVQLQMKDLQFLREGRESL